MTTTMQSTEESVRILTTKLMRVRGRLTVADASTATGLSIEEAHDALNEMMNAYVCRLQVTESGEILYDFGSSLRRRGEMTFKEKLAAIRAGLWKAFTVVFKIWITVMLVVYFVIFVVLLLAILLSSQGKDRKGVRLGWIGDLFADLFFFSSRGMVLGYGTDRYGYRHRTYRQSTRKDENRAEPRKRFVQSVYDFVFGPPRPSFDPFANEKEVLAWLRANKGVLTTAEIIALAGWTYPEAEERMADYLTRFKGVADITDDGVLIGTFPRVLAQGDAALEGGSVELFWDEFEAPYQLTGNTSGRNAAILGMNAFTLVFSAVVVLSPALQARISELTGGLTGSGDVMMVVLGWIPFIFSLLFFLVPFARWLQVKRDEAARVERNKLRRVTRIVFDTVGYDVTLGDVMSAVNRGGKNPLSEAEVKRLLERVLSGLQGSSDLREDGTTVYRFQRLHTEHTTVARVRAQSGESGSLGDVIFDAGPQQLPDPA